MLRTTVALLLAVSIALPAMAQTPATSSAGRSPASFDSTVTQSAASSSSARDPAVSDNGSLRVSRIVGSPVYNDHDEKIGSVDDLVIDNDRTINVVISVGGFLGFGSKMVGLPFNKLEFGYIKGSSDNRVVAPGVNKDSLTGMPEYHYINRG